MNCGLVAKSPDPFELATIETIPQGAYVEQWVKGGRIGNYFAPVGQAPEAGGIARAMRTPIAFEVTFKYCGPTPPPSRTHGPLGQTIPSKCQGAMHSSSYLTRMPLPLFLHGKR